MTLIHFGLQSIGNTCQNILEIELVLNTVHKKLDLIYSGKKKRNRNKPKEFGQLFISPLAIKEKRLTNKKLWPISVHWAKEQ